MLRFVATFLFAASCLHPSSAAAAAERDCVDLWEESGNITEIYPGPRNSKYHKCWTIRNPDDQLLKLELKEFDLERRSCYYVHLTITANRTGDAWKWCPDNVGNKSIVAYSNVTVYFYVDSGELTPYSRKNFELHYHIDNTIGGVEGVREARDRGVQWLKSNASSSLNWIHHIPKAVTALALTGGADFDGKNLKEELMLKQRELRISVSLLRDGGVSSEELSTFINSVLSTCRNPRNFYGHDLVDLLKRQVVSENFTHPASYLALCNANETWPHKAYYDLISTYDTRSHLPFRRDFQAFAVMALSCLDRRTSNRSLIPYEEKLFRHYEETIGQFKRLQEADGRFGNNHRTALIIQALIASGHEDDSDWHLHRAVKYLLKSAAAPPIDFLSTYLMLPLLNQKTLVDIARINCSSLKDKGDLITDIHDYLGPKIQVQYSLFIGEAKEVIHTIILKVPKYFRALDVMEFAALKDTKYKFRYEWVSGKVDIYEVADIPNDPEDGKFWLFYLKGHDFMHSAKGPNQLVLEEGDHIAMWYKRAHSFV